MTRNMHVYFESAKGRDINGISIAWAGSRDRLYRVWNTKENERDTGMYFRALSLFPHRLRVKAAYFIRVNAFWVHVMW